MLPEFIRRKRYHRYGHESCKKYLRIDFNHKCAYCHTSEAEVISGHKYFEIDHFRPQALADATYDVHDYENLFYSCRLCNGPSGKSDTWNEQLLNPCKDSIYGTHVSFPISDDYKLQVLTQRGEQYIETFKLNQKSQRLVRRKRMEHQKMIAERTVAIKEAISKLDEVHNPDIQIENSKKKLEEMLVAFEKELVGPYYTNTHDHCTSDFENERIFEAELQEVCKYEKVYHDYDIDYIFITRLSKVYCYHRIVDNIVFQNKRKSIRVPTKQAKSWNDFIGCLLIVIYSIEDNLLYYVDFQEHIERMPIDPDSQYYSIWINEGDILTNEAILNAHLPRSLEVSNG